MVHTKNNNSFINKYTYKTKFKLHVWNKVSGFLVCEKLGKQLVYLIFNQEWVKFNSRFTLELD